MKVQALLLAATVATASAFTAPSGNGVRLSTSLFGEMGEKAGTEMGAQEMSALTKDVQTVLSSEEIDAVLPHRYPFALVDKVVEYYPGTRAVGIKSVTKNEEFFQGHFPDRKVMPGVLQVEALAQLAGIVCLQMEGAEPGSLFFFAGVDGVKWKKPVIPGDTLVMEVNIKKWNKKFGGYRVPWVSCVPIFCLLFLINMLILFF
jgi:3-hydroxyacyl-[acyl-carrier-protein] dehydratase